MIHITHDKQFLIKNGTEMVTRSGINVKYDGDNCRTYGIEIAVHVHTQYTLEGKIVDFLDIFSQPLHHTNRNEFGLMKTDHEIILELFDSVQKWSEEEKKKHPDAIFKYV